MALVKTLRVDDSVKINGKNTPHYHNATFYIVGTSAIYKYTGSVLTTVYNRNVTSYTKVTSSAKIDDDIYCLEYQSSNGYIPHLYRFNITNGTYTEVGTLPKLSSGLQAFAYIQMFVWKNRLFYADRSNGGIHEIDTTTGVVTQRMSYNFSNVTCQIVVDGDFAYTPTNYDTDVIRIDMNTFTYTTVINGADTFYQAGAFIRGGSLYYTFGYSDELYRNPDYAIREYNFTTNLLSSTAYNQFDAAIDQRQCVTVGDDVYMFTNNGIAILSFKEYNLTFSMIDNGDVGKSFTEQSPITQLTFNYEGNNVECVFTTLTGDTVGSYIPTIPEGKKLIGFSLIPTATRPQFGLGVPATIYIDYNVNFYPVFGTYRPPTTTFDISLYQSSAEVNRVDKTDFLTNVGTLSGALREECSIIAPSITFKQTTVPTFNYVYIAAFGRYYFVTGITSISKDIWRMSLSCDVLMTWRDEIGALTAIVARQENSFNPLLLDSELPAQANQNITVTEFPAGGFNTTDAIAYPYVLTVVGG